MWLPSIAPKWTSVGFLLDTGAATTCVHPLDALARVDIPLGDLIDPTKWGHPENYGGVGGGARYFVVPAYYALLQDDGQWLQIPGDIRIAEATLGNLKLPSLFGRDLLERFKTVIDWSNRTIELQ